MSTTADQLKNLYKKSKKRKILAISSLFLVLLVSMVVSISVGAGAPTFMDAVKVIASRVFPFLNINPGSELTQSIILDTRLPRLLLAVKAGAGLAASGASMQGVLRNPLVSSYTLGISAGAGFGAALAIVFQIGVFTEYPAYVTVANAFLFSLIAVSIVYGIARMRGISSETVILSGIAVGYLFSAALSFIQYVTPEHEAVRSVVFWLLGSFVSASWTSVFIVLPFVAITIIFMIRYSWDLNVMSLGEDTASSTGVNSKRVLTIYMILTTIATASIVSFTGILGFICLVSPHIARMLIGNDHRFLIICSILVGSSLLLCSDTLARMVLYKSDIPVGIITSLLGIPFFIYLLLSRKQRSW
jgi:iron complex transport system permease protein